MGRGSGDGSDLDDVEHFALDDTAAALLALMTEPRMRTLADGTREWYRDGKLHRDDGPAVEHSDGTRMWCRNGKLHREDSPAIEFADGRREWWRDGKRHRVATAGRE